MAKVNIMYEVNDVVPEGGEYICVPCGKRDRFEKGDKFPSCLACADGRAQGAEGEVLAGEELWEKVSDE